MPSLICLVQRLTLRDGQLVREKELFEVDEPTAEMYVKGGIAKPVEQQPVKKPEPVPVKEVPHDPVQTEASPPQKVKADQKKRGR